MAEEWYEVEEGDIPTDAYWRCAPGMPPSFKQANLRDFVVIFFRLVRDMFDSLSGACTGTANLLCEHSNYNWRAHEIHDDVTRDIESLPVTSEE